MDEAGPAIRLLSEVKSTNLFFGGDDAMKSGKNDGKTPLLGALFELLRLTIG